MKSDAPLRWRTFGAVVGISHSRLHQTLHFLVREKMEGTTYMIDSPSGVLIQIGELKIRL